MSKELASQGQGRQSDIPEQALCILCGWRKAGYIECWQGPDCLQTTGGIYWASSILCWPLIKEAAQSLEVHRLLKWQQTDLLSRVRWPECSGVGRVIGVVWALVDESAFLIHFSALWEGLSKQRSQMVAAVAAWPCLGVGTWNLKVLR